MREAIRAVERHVFVEGLSMNPIELVEGSVTAFTWEFDSYWRVDPTSNSYYPRMDSSVALTIEHVKRAGELIAEGIALLFLEQRLGVSRANCRFIPPRGNTARPDYAFKPTSGTHLDILCPGLPRMQLEVRSRQRFRSMTKRDIEQLTAKKLSTPSGLPKQTLAIYCSYGRARSRRETRLILADPPGDDSLVTEDIAVPTSLINYERITARIGLWYHNSLLRKEIRRQELPIDLSTAFYDERNPPRVQLAANNYRSARYRGRDFSSLLSIADRRPDIVRDLYLGAIERGDLGALTFHGLNVNVLNYIEAGDWKNLASFLDRGQHDEGAVDSADQTSDESSPIVTGDGVYRRTQRVQFETADGREIVNVLKRRLER